MRKVHKSIVIGSILLSSVMSAIAMADTFTGSTGVYSKYILRGITNNPQSDTPAVQGGVNYQLSNGLFAGYYGSSLSYGDPGKSNGFENDFFGGYGNKIGDFKYSLGLVQYEYVNVSTANGAEAFGSIGYGPLTLGAHSLIKDVVWGNKGDTYWTLDYTTPLPKGFIFDALLGYYTYKNSGTYIASTSEKSAFRQLNLTLSHPIGNTGANAGITYVVGGKDRNGITQKNAVFLNVTYNFDIK